MENKKLNVDIKVLPSNRLSVEEERELVLLCRANDEAARTKLNKTFFPFVASIAKKYKNYFTWIAFDELIEEGNFGLLQALDHFDMERKVRFSSYAWFWIVKSMQDYITSTLSFMKIPAKVSSNLKKITKMIENGIAENKDLTLEDITTGLDMEMEKVKELLSNQAKMSAPISLDQFIDGQDQKNTLKDILSSGEKSSDDVMDGIEDDGRMLSILATLEENEAEVIRWRFGFKDYKYHTLKDIAAKLGVTPQKVSDLESVALAKLKKLVAENENIC